VEHGARSHRDVEELKTKLEAFEERLNSLPPVE